MIERVLTMHIRESFVKFFDFVQHGYHHALVTKMYGQDEVGVRGNECWDLFKELILSRYVAIFSR